MAGPPVTLEEPVTARDVERAARRRPGDPEGGEPAANRLVQAPRRGEQDLAPRRRRAEGRGGGGERRQPRPGGRGGGASAEGRGRPVHPGARATGKGLRREVVRGQRAPDRGLLRRGREGGARVRRPGGQGPDSALRRPGGGGRRWNRG